ncbi:MAG: asparagine synthase (glutamine-hydrolyzing) [Candidatus Omnitrophica bacterium]|nr:asparagine synthase (glutamine-hydrolyzing) [Candidatus Omnitrophota bacterium]
MCGIAGYKIAKPIENNILEKMLEALYHRGPDSQGFYHSNAYNAGMRRLKINDLKTGDQPLFNFDKSVVLLYNGEIYNSPSLRKLLETKGYRFRTHCDGEVVCHLYDEYGEDLFEKLDGMFSVALWVEKKKRLILVRDIPGEKPLYYSQLSETELVFSSEIKSLKFFPNLNLSLNRQAIWDFPTFLWVPEPDTVYQSVKALAPSHMLIADNEGIRIKKYGNNFNKGAIDLSDYSVIKETRRVVEEAVKSRLLSDVPLGCFLSGGLDSSIVTTLAARYTDKLSTFTVGFENISDPYHGLADESYQAEQYAKKLGTQHHSIQVVSKSFLDLLDNFCKYSDQPFAVSSGFGLLAIAKAAKEKGIKVLLSGDGADENFGGYSWYQHLMMENLSCNNYEDKNNNISFQNFGMEIKDRLNVLSSYNAQRRAWAWHYYASENEKCNLFSSDFYQGAQSSLRYFSDFKSEKEWQAKDYINQDKEFYLPNEMLRKVDRMTMAYSIEGRSPFVSPSVLSHTDKLKYNHLIRDNSLKWVLKKAFEDILPNSIINRPKHGFNVPIDHWLKDEWFFMVEESFSKSSALYKNGIIHKDSFKVAKAMLFDKERLNGHTIFTFIILNNWLEKAD